MWIWYFTIFPISTYYPPYWGFPDSSFGKESTCNAGDPASIPGLGRSAGEGIGYPFQYSWLKVSQQLKYLISRCLSLLGFKAIITLVQLPHRIVIKIKRDATCKAFINIRTIMPDTSSYEEGILKQLKSKCQLLSSARHHDPMDYSLPGSSVHGILQARILEWVAISYSRGSSQPRDRILVSCLAGGFLTTVTTWKAINKPFKH